jgi:hypothetical protein
MVTGENKYMCAEHEPSWRLGQLRSELTPPEIEPRARREGSGLCSFSDAIIEAQCSSLPVNSRLRVPGMNLVGFLYIFEIPNSNMVRQSPARIALVTVAPFDQPPAALQLFAKKISLRA